MPVVEEVEELGPRLEHRISENVVLDAPSIFRLTMREPRCKIELEVDLEDGRLVCNSYTASRLPDGPPITANMLKALPVVDAIATAVATSSVAGAWWYERYPSRGVRLEREHIDAMPGELATATIYKMAYFVGRNPTERVAASFGITRAAAAKRVQRARAAGYLEPTTRGRKGA